MPQHARLFRVTHACEVQQHAEVHAQRILRRMAAVNMPDRIIDLGFNRLALKSLEMIQIFVRRFGNNVKI